MAIYKNPVIKTLSKELFDLDRLDFIILGEFAKKGDTLRCTINLAELSDRQISRRIDVLYKFGFLYLKKSTPYRSNSKMYPRETKVFSLSLKGFIASLHLVDFENNYLTKKYLKEIKDNQLSKVVLDYLKNDLIYFLTHNKYRGITLNKMKNIVGWLDDYHSVYGFRDKDLEVLNKLDDKRIKSWETMKKMTLNNHILNNYVDWWYGVIDLYANSWNYDKIIKKISVTSSIPSIEARNALVSVSNGHIISGVESTDVINIFRDTDKKI